MSKSPKSKARSMTPPPDWKYEQGVERIESIIHRIEVGELELADVFSEFESAVEEINRCESFLIQRQSQVELLIETLVDSDA